SLSSILHHPLYHPLFPSTTLFRSLALNLAITQTEFGDWRELFRQVDRIDKVTAADVRRVANQTFTTNNRTIAYIDNSAPPQKSRSEEHTSELQSLRHLVCRLLLEK